MAREGGERQGGMPDDSLQAELDQLGATLRDFAPVLGTYFRALVDEGFTRAEALQLAIAWQAKTGGDIEDDG